MVVYVRPAGLTPADMSKAAADARAFAALPGVHGRVTGPIPSADHQAMEIGFCVAIGVLIDTIIVRSVLVTALNLDLGDRIWWPGRLSRPSGEVTVAAGTPVPAARR